MAITHDADSESQNDTSGDATLAWSHVVGSGTNRILFVGTGCRNDGGEVAVSSIVRDGQSFTKIAHQDRGGFGNLARAELWYLVDPNVGTSDITVTWASNVASKSGGAASFFGASLVDPLGDLGQEGGCSGSPSISITPEATDSFVIDVLGLQDSGDVVVNGSQTQIAGANPGRCWMSYESTASQDPVVMSWTNVPCYGHIAQEFLIAPVPSKFTGKVMSVNLNI